MSPETAVAISFLLGLATGIVVTYWFTQQRKQKPEIVIPENIIKNKIPPLDDNQATENSTSELNLYKSFGRGLRVFRLKANLTQTRFGELLGNQLGMDGYSAAAISSWERDRTFINARDRYLLIKIVKILIEQGGITTPHEANQLLTSGGFSTLDTEETRTCFIHQAYKINLQG